MRGESNREKLEICQDSTTLRNHSPLKKEPQMGSHMVRKHPPYLLKSAHFSWLADFSNPEGVSEVMLKIAVLI